MLTVSENVRLAGETGSNRPMVKTALLTVSPVATTGANRRFEDFRQQLSAIIRWPPHNVINCHRSAGEGNTIRLSPSVGGCHGMARLFDSRAFIRVAERV